MQAIVEQMANGLKVIGHVDFTNAAAVFQQGQQLIAQQKLAHHTIDLSSLDNSSTIVLAVLVQWLRQTLAAGSTLTILNVPEKLKAIIATSNLSDAFKL